MFGYNNDGTVTVYRKCQCCFEFVPKSDTYDWIAVFTIGDQIVLHLYNICETCYYVQVRLRAESRYGSKPKDE